MTHTPAPNEYQLRATPEYWGHELQYRQPFGPWTLVAYDNRTDEPVERKTFEKTAGIGTWAQQQGWAGRGVWIIDPSIKDRGEPPEAPADVDPEAPCD